MGKRLTAQPECFIEWNEVDLGTGWGGAGAGGHAL